MRSSVLKCSKVHCVTCNILSCFIYLIVKSSILFFSSVSQFSSFFFNFCAVSFSSFELPPLILTHKVFRIAFLSLYSSILSLSMPLISASSSLHLSLLPLSTLLFYLNSLHPPPSLPYLTPTYLSITSPLFILNSLHPSPLLSSPYLISVFRYDIATLLLGHPPLFNFPSLQELITREKKKKYNTHSINIYQDGKKEKQEGEKNSDNRNINTDSIGGLISSGQGDDAKKHPTRDSSFSLPLSSDSAEESDRFQDCKHFLALSRGGAFTLCR